MCWISNSVCYMAYIQFLIAILDFSTKQPWSFRVLVMRDISLFPNFVFSVNFGETLPTKMCVSTLGSF